MLVQMYLQALSWATLYAPEVTRLFDTDDNILYEPFVCIKQHINPDKLLKW
jgi:hypothetical protein